MRYQVDLESSVSRKIEGHNIRHNELLELVINQLKDTKHYIIIVNVLLPNPKPKTL